MAANTLYDYYTGQGQKLPSVAERSKIYETSGLGSASEYQGTAEQNTSLLKSLQNPVVPDEIDASDLGNKEVDLPPAPTGTNPNALMSGLDAMGQTAQAQMTEQQQRFLESQKMYQDAQMFQGVNPAEQTYDASVQGLIDLQGKSQEATKKQAELQMQATSDLQKRLDALNLQAAQLKGSYLQGLTDVEGKVMPMRFITGQQAQIQRQYATQAASVALEQQALQGNIENARAIADQMIQMEYGDIEQQIAYQKDIINLNYDKLTSSEKKRADELNFILGQEEKRVAEEKANKQAVQDIAIKLGEYGVDTKTIQNVLNSKNIDEALISAGENLQNPTVKAQLESIKLDQQLTKMNIAKQAYELQLLQRYDGLTPSQYAAKLKEEQEEINALSSEQEKALAQGEALQAKITLLDSVLNNKAIDSVVGPTPLARKATGFKGFVGRLAMGVLPAFQGAKDVFTGDDDKLIGQVEQFISKEFLDNLIDVKARGATFGALQKAEQDALTASATFIGQRRILDKNDNVVGYNLAEDDFKNEIKNIQDITRKAYERATGNVFDNSEQSILNSVFSNESTTPSIYFN